MKLADLQKLHKKIYQYTKNLALSYEGETSKDLKKYRQDFQKFSKRKFQVTTENKLLKSILDSSVIYLGDFHTFDQSSRNLQRVLRKLIEQSQKHKFFLGVELAFHQHQKHINSFLNDDITELEFLQSINYSNSWRFPWPHYKPFFLWAKEFGIEILALNSRGKMGERDQFAATIIADTINQYPEAQFLVLFGEYHIVPNKIPAIVQKKLDDREMRYTIIHQNLDDVYWKLSRNKKQQTIIKFNDDEYSLQNSPPWVKYESMIYWFENLDDDPEFDLHEYIIESGVKAFGTETDDNFLRICQEIINLLGLNLTIKQHELEDFNLYDHTQIAKVNDLIDSTTPVNKRKLDHYLLETGRSFRISDSNSYYCPNYSINRLSYLAGIHIYNCLRVKDNLKKRPTTTERFVELFHILFWAYLASKIFNPQRKCDLYKDYKQKLNLLPNSSREYQQIECLLKIVDTKKSLNSFFERKRYDFIYEVARLSAHYFAEIFFIKLRNQKKEKMKNFISEVLPSVHFQQSDFKKLKNNLFSSKSYKTQKKRVF